MWRLRAAHVDQDACIDRFIEKKINIFFPGTFAYFVITAQQPVTNLTVVPGCGLRLLAAWHPLKVLIQASNCHPRAASRCTCLMAALLSRVDTDSEPELVVSRRSWPTVTLGGQSRARDTGIAET